MKTHQSMNITSSCILKLCSPIRACFTCLGLLNIDCVAIASVMANIDG